MTRFHKIQKYSSIIPVFSTIFIVFVTMFELKKQRASLKLWLCTILTFLLSGVAVYILNTVVMTGQHLILNLIVTGLALAIANILLVDIQVKSLQEQGEKTENPKMVRNIIIGVLVGVLAIGAILLVKVLCNPANDIADTNGSENTSLAVITTDEILATRNDYSAFATSVSRTGAQTNVAGRLKTYDYQNVSFSSKKISGIMTLQTTQTTHNRLTLEIDAQLKAGNMELVIIVDDQLYDRIPVNQKTTVTLSDIAGKTVVVRLAAESAETRVVVTRMEE